MHDSDKKILTKVVDLEGVLFEGEVYAISSINELGSFDILSEHANFIALIQEKVDLYIEKNSPKSFPLKTGILRCQNGAVEIVLGIESQLSGTLEK